MHEDNGICISAASPNTTLRLLQGKCWSTALPTSVVVTLVAIIAEILIRPGWLWAATAVLLVVAQTPTLTILMVAIGAVFALFDWSDAPPMLHPASAFLRVALFPIVTGSRALVLS